MMPDFEDGFYFEMSHSDQMISEKSSIECPKIEDFSYLINKCNLHLLKRKLVCLFGYPSITVESDKIFSYLEGIEDQNQTEQKRILRVLISFIGEATFIEDWEERNSTIRTRVEQFLSMKGFGIPWNDDEWKLEIESLFESQYINPYYSKLPYSQFEYEKFFSLLESPLPLQLRNLNHPSYSQVLIAKSNDDFKYLCNALEFKNIKRIRKYIWSIIEKQEEFSELLQKIEFNDFADYNEVKQQFDILNKELDNIIQADLLLVDKSKAKSEIRRKAYKMQDDQTEIHSLIKTETQTAALTLTTVTNNEIKTKKQKKKLKNQSKFEIPYQFLVKFESESNSQEIASNKKVFELQEQQQLQQQQQYQQFMFQQQQYQEQSQQLQQQQQQKQQQQQCQLQQKQQLQQQQPQKLQELQQSSKQLELNLTQEEMVSENAIVQIPKQPIKVSYNLEETRAKIASYEKISDALESLGYPCVNLDEQRLKQIVRNFNQYYNDKQILLQQIASCVWETLAVNSVQSDVFNVVNQKVQTYIHSINLSISQEEYTNILNSCYEKTAFFPQNDKFQIEKFCYQKLSTIVNRQFPDQIYKYSNTSSRIIYKAKSIVNLQQIINSKEIQNVRIIRAYIKELYQILQKLINFKHKIEKVRNNKRIDDQLAYLFYQQEQELIKFQFKQLNFKLNSKNESQNMQFQNNNYSNSDVILIDDQKEELDKYFNFNLEKAQKDEECEVKQYLEIEDSEDVIVKKEFKTESKSNAIKIGDKLKISIEQCFQKNTQTEQQQKQQEQQYFDLVTPTNNPIVSPFLVQLSPQFNDINSPMYKGIFNWGDGNEGLSPNIKQQSQFQHHFNY